MPKGKIIQSRPQFRRILHHFRKTKNRFEALRCQILIANYRGVKTSEISQSLQCARATIYRTFQRWLYDGEEALVDQRFLTPPPKIPEAIKERLLELLDELPNKYGWSRTTWTLELFGKQLLREFNVKLSKSTIHYLLCRLNCSRVRARPCLRKPIAGRAKILRAIKRRIKKASSQEEVFYQDEADIDLNPRVGYCYVRKGTQPKIETPGKNQKWYLAGALNVRTGKVIVTDSATKASSLYIKLLEKLLKTYKKAKRIHLILDNYIIHKSKVTKQWIEQYGKRIRFYFLPPYSPEANKIEGLWKQLHDNVTRNHVQKNIQSLVKQALSFLNAIQPYPGTKVSLMKF